MSTQQQTPLTTETCLCRDAVRKVQDLFGISPQVREHLNNSRVEFLRAIRAVIDQRIDTLLATRQEGTKITVE